MEKSPLEQSESSVEQLHARLSQIDKAIIELTDGLNRVPAPFETSSHLDDDAEESEQVQQALGDVSMELQQLRHEKEAIESELQRREQHT